MIKNLISQKDNFSRFEVILAIAFYIAVLLLLYLFGLYYDSFPIIKIFTYSFRTLSFIEYAMVIGLLVITKRQLRSIGVTKKNYKESILLGIGVGIFFLIISLILSQINGTTFRGMNYLSFGIVYYTIEIGLIEELIFRGFIQTRFVGYFKNKFLAVILTGIFFSLFHIPFQILQTDYSLLEYLSHNYSHLITTFLYHFLCTALYYKYNNILAPTIVHLFINLSFSMYI